MIGKHLNAESVSVWDAEDKKVVMIFPSVKAAAQLIYNKEKTVISNWIVSKKKVKLQQVNRVVFFRYTKDEHKQLLNDNLRNLKGIVLDKRYLFSPHLKFIPGHE